MKQGQASTSGMSSTKREPISHKVNVAAVAEQGIHTVRHTQVPMYAGRGLEAPMQGTSNHPTGSQGKHK
jgi:hypothetical protein